MFSQVSVILSTGGCGKGGGMCGEEGVHGKGGGMHGEGGHVWQGACMAKGACVVKVGRAWQVGGGHGRRASHCSGRYA